MVEIERETPDAKRWTPNPMNITRKSMISGKTRTRRLLIREATPHLSDDNREFIMTGIMAEEWDEAFPDDEDEDLDEEEPAF